MSLIPDACESFNLKVDLHHSVIDVYPNIKFDHKNIVQFDIIDLRWNKNSYMWNALYQAIKEYHSS